MSNPTAEALLANPIFRELSLAERVRVVEASKVATFEPRETILAEGDPAERFYVLLSGSVRVFHSSPSGLEVVVKIFKPPSVFGEMEGLVGIPFLENVDALERSELLVVPRPVLTQLLTRHHAVALALLTDVCARLCIASDNEKSLAFHTVRTRLAHFLVCYAQFDGEVTAEGTRIRLRLTQDDMADALGVTRRAIAREVIRWQSLGVLRQQRGRYVLCDVPALVDEAEGLQLGLTYAIGQKLRPLADSD